MDTRTTTHPAIIVAALTVTLAALTATGSLLGLLPAHATPAPDAPMQSAGLAPATPVAGRAEGTAASSAAAPAPVSTRPHRVASAPAKTAPAHPRPTTTEPRPATAAVAPTEVSPAEPPTRVPAPPVCDDCAVVTQVREVTRDGDGDGSGLGAVAGGVVGGLVGNRLGKGSGRDLLTVLGAAGGAFAGHQIEKRQRRSTVQEVTVRFEDGHTAVLSDTATHWREGDRVRVRNDQLAAR